MEYQNIINFYTIHQNNPLILGQKIGLKQMMAHMERITPIVKLNLKLHCQSQFYVIIVIHIYL